MKIINNEYLKKFSPIPLNFNMEEVNNYVELAQIIYILPVLGEPLYDEICEQVENDDLTPENGTLLLEAIWPLLGFATVHEALPFLWAHVSEVSITKGHSENSDALSLKDLTLIQQHLRNQIEVRQQYAIDWLNAHADSFPLYVPKGCGCDKCGNKLTKNYYKDFYTPYRRCTNLR